MEKHEAIQLASKYAEKIRVATERGYVRNTSKPELAKIRKALEIISGKQLSGNIYCCECQVKLFVSLGEALASYKSPEPDQQTTEDSKPRKKAKNSKETDVGKEVEETIDESSPVR